MFVASARRFGRRLLAAAVPRENGRPRRPRTFPIPARASCPDEQQAGLGRSPPRARDRTRRRLSGAAKALRLNHATVFRRLNAIEERLGVRLFDRFRSGYAPTPAGEEVVALARRIEGDVEDLERRLADQDGRPHGPVRITTTDTLLPIVATCLAEVRGRQPQILPELVVSNSFLSLARREADIAVRPTREPPPELVGRRIAGIAFAVYRAESLDVPSRLAWRDLPWIALEDELAHLAAAKWMKTALPDARIVAREQPHGSPGDGPGGDRRRGGALFPG